MEILTDLFVGGQEFIHWLIGGGMTVMALYLTAVFTDIITGYIKALKDHNWRSALNLQGVLIKLATIFAIITAAILDDLAPIFGVNIPINISLVFTGILTIYEVGSILENFTEMGVNVGFIKKYLGVFNDKYNDDRKDGK